jgi:hypothetical protein
MKCKNEVYSTNHFGTHLNSELQTLSREVEHIQQGESRELEKINPNFYHVA